MGKLKDWKGISFFDTLYKSLVFRDLLIVLFPAYQKRHIIKTRVAQTRKIEDCRQKEVVKVAFFLQTASIWKYDNLYWLMKKSEHFEPVVVISPYNVHLVYDKKECFNVMRETIRFAEEQKYNYLSSYDFEKHKWLNIKRLINPDVVFFTKPYKDTFRKYHIYNFKNQLTLYAPYGFLCINLFREHYNLPFQNFLWKLMLETEMHKEYDNQYSLCKGDNCLVVGSFGTEKLIDPNYRMADVWKPQDRPKKKIIWAPHHTVDYLFNFSNFLDYCDLMLDLAEKYKDEIQFAFKPHPVLKFKLINIWGKEKTEEYYRKWKDGDNTQLEEGYYIDLFLGSDAMIHDCASFTVEYLFTQKPVLFMVKDKDVESHWNSFGRKCYDVHYKAKVFQEIEDFVTNVVLQGNDFMKPARDKFFYDTLIPKDGALPSENIYQYLKDVLNK